MKADLVKKNINRCARERIPFLFGVDFELSEGFFVEEPLDNDSILFACGSVSNIKPDTSDKIPVVPEIEILSSDYKEYKQRFETVRQGLLYGDSFLTNLTQRTPIKCNISLEEILHRSQAHYKLFIPDHFVCFSPECFIRINNGQIHSFPMKGTIDAILPNAEEQLLNSYKELCEHNTIVDLIRNDLNSISNNVRVERFRYVERVATSYGEILQTSSEIIGDLPGGWQEQLGDLLFNLLPAGSISGAPKHATLRLIRCAEQYERGYYSGVFGYFDGENLDSAVMIRYIEKQGDNLFFRSGGGITIHSNAECEYDEVIKKIYLPIPYKL